MHEPYYLSLPLTWVASLKIHFQYLYCFQIKSSSTWAILLPSVQGHSFTFLLLSHHPFFEHLLESIAVILSVTCLSRNKINCGITMMFESFDIFTSSLLLNFWGALAFMFCSTKKKGKRDTTLSYLVMNIAILQVLMFHVAYYCVGIFS